MHQNLCLDTPHTNSGNKNSEYTINKQPHRNVPMRLFVYNFNKSLFDLLPEINRTHPEGQFPIKTILKTYRAENIQHRFALRYCHDRTGQVSIGAAIFRNQFPYPRNKRRGIKAISLFIRRPVGCGKFDHTVRHPASTHGTSPQNLCRGARSSVPRKPP